MVSSLLVAWHPVRDILLQLGMGERDRLLPERGERESIGLEQQLWKEHWGELNGLVILLSVGVAVKYVGLDGADSSKDERNDS